MIYSYGEKAGRQYYKLGSRGQKGEGGATYCIEREIIKNTGGNIEIVKNTFFRVGKGNIVKEEKGRFEGFNN